MLATHKSTQRKASIRTGESDYRMPSSAYNAALRRPTWARMGDEIFFLERKSSENERALQVLLA